MTIIFLAVFGAQQSPVHLYCMEKSSIFAMLQNIYVYFGRIHTDMEQHDDKQLLFPSELSL